MRSLRVRTSIEICVVAAILAVALGLVASSWRDYDALATSGCADVDGDGFVHTTDITMMGAYFGQTVPPAPPQVDVNKDGSMTVTDWTDAIPQFGTSTTCQASALAKITAAGGVFVVDADGENPVATDPIESARGVEIGETLRAAVQMTANPVIFGYQVQVHWDEALLDLQPRTAQDNDVWLENDPGVGQFAMQALGPADDDSGTEAYVETGVSFKASPSGPSTSYLGPMVQFEFTCQAEGLAEITLAGAGSHTVLSDIPATEYTPIVRSAVILCFGSVDGDGDGLPDGYEGDNTCLDPEVDDAGADPDGDGLHNLAEFGAVTNPCEADTDEDGLTDDLEVQVHGTDPRNADSDIDAMPDVFEVDQACLNAVLIDADEDPDGDGRGNLAEFELGTDPCTTNVGGVAELPAVAGAPYEAGGGFGANAGVVAGAAAAMVVGALALGGAAWWARRRARS